MAVLLQENSFEPAEQIRLFEASLPAGSFGATASFVGTMRHHNEGDSVTAMTLEHYPGMTEKQLDNGRLLCTQSRRLRCLPLPDGSP